MTTIYLLVDPQHADARYIGQTKGFLLHRLKAHCDAARRGKQTYVYRWIRQLLTRDSLPVIVPLEETEEADQRERFWIAHYRKAGCRLTNCTDGGGGGAMPLEVRARIGRKVSLALKGRPKSPEHAAKVGAAQRGKPRRPHTEEEKAKIGAAHLGKKWPNRKRPPRESVERARQKNIANPPRATLTPAQVEQARQEYKDTTETVSELARRLGLSLPQGYQILTGKTWTWVPGPTFTSEQIRARAAAARVGIKRGPMSAHTKRKLGASISATKQAKKGAIP